ncbi:MAG: hypothetical protein K9N05_04695 [Candidatus Marinimicrobia bacterium]|nr:hypothetical protein [Candidatus Neomarinimicrobiota bacterium]
MKRISHLIIIFILLFGAGWASNDLETENMMRNLSYLSIPIDHEHASFQFGFVLNPDQSLFPIAGVNVPFGGAYYLTGGLGAGIDQNDQGELTLFYLGLGFYDRFPGLEDLNYTINASIRSFQSLDYHSNILAGEFLLEQCINDLRIGVGLSFGVQDYIINNTGFYNEADERTYPLAVKVLLRSPYGNIEIKGMPNSIILGASWTFKLEETE